MSEEALHGLALRDGGTYVDATYGAGGHSRAILSGAKIARLVALDRDPTVQPFTHPFFHFVQANFRDLASVLRSLDIDGVDGILFDFGISSMQVDQAERGFSFQQDAPLDMRMDRSQGETAFELLRECSEKKLADILFHYGEERAARRIARGIIALRERGRLPATTGELARCISGMVHRSGTRERIHPATRSFQALRIAVNDELGAIESALTSASRCLRIHGRVVAISFHSLEDRIVKHHLRDDPLLHVLTRKPLLPTDGEIQANPRARSARLRIAERIEVA